MPCPFCQKPITRPEKHLESIHGLVINVGRQPAPYYGGQPGSTDRLFWCGVPGYKRQKINGVARYVKHLQDDHSVLESAPLLRECWRHPHLKHPLREWNDWTEKENMRQSTARKRRNEEMGQLHDLMDMDGKELEIVPLGTTEPIVHTETYRYLGRVFQEGGSSAKHINERRANAAWKMAKLKPVFKSMELDISIKVKLWTSIGLTSMLYALNAIPLASYQAAALQSTHMRILRWATNMNPRYVPSEESGGESKLKYPKTKEVLATANLRYYGHLLRRPNNFAPKRIIGSLPVGAVKYAVGGMNGMWKSVMDNLKERLGLRDQGALNREEWRWVCIKESRNKLDAKRCACISWRTNGW